VSAIVLGMEPGCRGFRSLVEVGVSISDVGIRNLDEGILGQGRLQKGQDLYRSLCSLGGEISLRRAARSASRQGTFTTQLCSLLL
jgi:hypothetical protein